MEEPQTAQEPNMIEEAKAVAERIEKANAEAKALAERLEIAKSREILAGKSTVQVVEKKAEETPKQYAERVERGEF